MTKLTKLFEPGKIGTMELRNRIVMAPLGMPLGTAPDGYSTDRQIAFYEARAKGGAALIQLTVLALSAIGERHSYVPKILQLRDDEHIPSAQRITNAIHEKGAKITFHLSHAGIRMSESLSRRPPETHPEREIVVAPSAIRHPPTGWVPKALDKDEIEKIIFEFGLAAKRGRLAGFDGVEFMAAHGYLVHQFLSLRTNKRKDEYGGSLENRCRFACEIIKSIKKEAGADFNIVLRMNGEDFLDDGIQIDEAVEQARIFEDAGADAIDVSSGPRETHHWQFITMYQPSGALIPSSAAIKKAVNIPVIIAGKIDVLLAERILEEDVADFIHLGRPLMADPDLPNKAKEGRLADIRPCIYCNQCRDRRWMTGDWDPCCTVNPGLGKETTYLIEPAEKPKKVMVVGGGLAGMEAARTLAERGHETSLYEKSDKLGGQWNIVSARIPDQRKLVQYLERGMEKVGVKVFYNQEVTPKMIEEMKPDAVVIATGAVVKRPDVPGVDRKNVVQAVDVLTGKVDTGREVVVVGGRLVGLDTAIFLAEQGKKVMLVTRSKVGRGLSGTNKLALMEKVIKSGIYLFQDSELQSVTDNGAYFLWDSGEQKVRGAERHEILFLKADTIVLALGSQSETALAEQVSGFMTDVYRVGDCADPREAFSAIHEGSEIGRKI